MTPEKVKKSVIEYMNSDEFTFQEFDVIQKPKVWYVILVNGKRVQLLGGKNIWNGIGAAKTALKFSIRAKLLKIKKDMVIKDEDGPNYGATNKAFNDATDKWINDHVVFVPFDDYMKIRKKREDK